MPVATPKSPDVDLSRLQLRLDNWMGPGDISHDRGLQTRHKAQAGKGEGEATSILGLCSSRCFWGHLEGGVYPASTSLKREKLQKKSLGQGYQWK